MTRDKIGLVLGAGGVRGCAHAGVIEVLHEEGIPIDLVVGASVGALFGLGVAAGVSVEQMSRFTRESTAFDLFRFYASRLRLNRGNPIARLLYDAAVGKTFDDLDLPFAVVATDVTTGEPVVIRSGPLIPALEASFALPLIARPVRIGDAYYLDGGIRAATPVHVAREMGAERVIAVHLGMSFVPPGAVRRAGVRRMLERLGRQRGPLRGHVLDQIRFGCRAYLSADDVPSPAPADVDIWPDVSSIPSNSVRGAAYCYRRGVEAAREALPQVAGWPHVERESRYGLEDISR